MTLEGLIKQQSEHINNINTENKDLKDKVEELLKKDLEKDKKINEITEAQTALMMAVTDLFMAVNGAK